MTAVAKTKLVAMIKLLLAHVRTPVNYALNLNLPPRSSSLHTRSPRALFPAEGHCGDGGSYHQESDKHSDLGEVLPQGVSKPEPLEQVNDVR
jgi:hypothetical protein